MVAHRSEIQVAYRTDIQVTHFHKSVHSLQVSCIGSAHLHSDHLKQMIDMK